jgi:dienelactone hydrolase
METNRRDALRLLSGGAAGLMLQRPECLLSDGFCPGGLRADGFKEMCFTDKAGAKHQVYFAGTGPPVLLLHEINGLTNETLATARQLAAGRYTAVVPLFFGEPGKRRSVFSAGGICKDDQFACNRAEKTSAHLTWLRELATCARAKWPDGKGVGVIGMCLTGAFPLAMLRAPEIVAPVLCQPTLPFSPRNIFHFLGWFTNQNALALDPADVDYVRTKTSMPILGIRYSGDRLCKKKRFERLTNEFKGRFYRLDVPGRHHSTLVNDFCQDAFTEVLAFFNQHLRTRPDPSGGTFPLRSRHSIAEVKPDSCRGSGRAASHSHST